MVVVYPCPRDQLCYRSRCCHQGEHYPPCMGLHRFAIAWNIHRTLGKLLPLIGPSTVPSWIPFLTLVLQSTLLYSRYGNGIATNNLSKMLAGLMLPGRPVGNMYFAACKSFCFTAQSSS